jgi:hypothetical protein
MRKSELDANCLSDESVKSVLFASFPRARGNDGKYSQRDQYSTQKHEILYLEMLMASAPFSRILSMEALKVLGSCVCLSKVEGKRPLEMKASLHPQQSSQIFLRSNAEKEAMRSGPRKDMRRIRIQ